MLRYSGWRGFDVVWFACVAVAYHLSRLEGVAIEVEVLPSVAADEIK